MLELGFRYRCGYRPTTPSNLDVETTRLAVSFLPCLRSVYVALFRPEMSNVKNESNSVNARLEATSGAADETFKRLFPRKYLCKCIEERNSRTDSRSFNGRGS